MLRSVDDTSTGHVRSSADGVRAPINDDDDVFFGALTVGCASNDDEDLTADGIDASTDGEDASTSDSDTIPLIIWSVDVGALYDGAGTLISVNDASTVDDTSICDGGGSWFDGIDASIGDTNASGIAASTIRTVDDSSSSSGDVKLLPRSAQLVLCQSVVPQTTTMISRPTASMLRPMGKTPQRATRTPFL
jgi:hypothetical protein